MLGAGWAVFPWKGDLHGGHRSFPLLAAISLGWSSLPRSVSDSIFVSACVTCEPVGMTSVDRQADVGPQVGDIFCDKL